MPYLRIHVIGTEPSLFVTDLLLEHKNLLITRVPGEKWGGGGREKIMADFV
jgi:hypothetical protein